MNKEEELNQQECQTLGFDRDMISINLRLEDHTEIDSDNDQEEHEALLPQRSNKTNSTEGLKVTNFLRIAGSMTTTCLFESLIPVSNMIFAGMLNDSILLAGVGLATTAINIFLFVPIWGMNGTVETLVSQAFGANNIHLCGVYVNRGRLINLVMFVPLAILLCFSESILVQFGQDAQVSVYASKYIMLCLPGTFF